MCQKKSSGVFLARLRRGYHQLTLLVREVANLEDDLRARVPQIINLDETAFQMELESLFRSYDPCLSCSTHLLTIERI